MKQREIWLTNLNSTKRSEQAGVRPVVIISGNLLNTHLAVVIACPLTSKIKGYKGNVILQPSEENGLTKESEILTFHIKSISKDRLHKRKGMISEEELEVIKSTLGDILRY